MKKHIMTAIAIACLALCSITIISQVQADTPVGDYNKDGKYTAVDALLASRMGYGRELVQGLLQIASGEKEMDARFRLKLVKQDGITELNQYEMYPNASELYYQYRQEVLDRSAIDIENAETEDEVASIVTNAKKEIDDISNQSDTGVWTPIV